MDAQIFLSRVSTIFSCYLLYTKQFILVSNPFLFLVPTALIIGGSKYFVFYHKSKWKDYISMFENLTLSTRHKILAITLISNLAMIIAFVKVFVMVYNIDWLNG